MQFNHEWLEKLKLERIDTPNGRRYITPNGDQYESVTTFLGRNDAHKFKKWEDTVGIEQANRTRQRAASRGSLLHHLVECYLCNDAVDFGKNILVKDLFLKFKPIINKINNIKAIEYPLYSDILKLAGTVDCVADYDGELSVIDFKTASSAKKAEDITNYFLQTTAYSFMIKEIYNLDIKRLVILIAVEGEGNQVFVETRRNWVPKLAELIGERKSYAAV